MIQINLQDLYLPLNINLLKKKLIKINYIYLKSNIILVKDGKLSSFKNSNGFVLTFFLSIFAIN